jgi:hypothetical protein
MKTAWHHQATFLFPSHEVSHASAISLVAVVGEELEDFAHQSRTSQRPPSQPAHPLLPVMPAKHVRADRKNKTIRKSPKQQAGRKKAAAEANMEATGTAQGSGPRHLEQLTLSGPQQLCTQDLLPVVQPRK